MNQPNLFKQPASPPTITTPKFHGDTYVAKWDQKRLATLLGQVYTAMSDGRWWTLSELQSHVGRGGEASISARIRDLDNQIGIPHEKRRRGDKRRGLFEYRLVLEQGGGAA